MSGRRRFGLSAVSILPDRTAVDRWRQHFTPISALPEEVRLLRTRYDLNGSRDVPLRVRFPIMLGNVDPTWRIRGRRALSCRFCRRSGSSFAADRRQNGAGTTALETPALPTPELIFDAANDKSRIDQRTHPPRTVDLAAGDCASISQRTEHLAQ